GKGARLNETPLHVADERHGTAEPEAPRYREVLQQFHRLEPRHDRAHTDTRSRRIPKTAPPSMAFSGPARHTTSNMTVTASAAIAGGSGAACGATRASALAITPMTPGPTPCGSARAHARVRLRPHRGRGASTRT